MKLYIPFNSNDFNSVFSTLSISPRGFYSQRKYSFKRAYECLLNPLEFSLIAYPDPTFSTKDYDKDNGYTVNIEVDLSNDMLTKISSKALNAYEIKDTIYLFNGFKLIFRTKKELVEILAKSLKSVETKFADLAKENSFLAIQFENAKFLDQEVKLRRADKISPHVSFQDERRTNKLIGSAMGFFIGLNNTIGGEYGRLKSLKRELENLKAVFLSNITQKSDNSEKDRILACLGELKKEFDQIEPISETILFNCTGLTSTEFAGVTSSKIYGFNTMDLILEGLMALNAKNLPMQLRIELTNRCLQSPFNTKYPDHYIKRFEENIYGIRENIDFLIHSKKKRQEINSEKLLLFEGLSPIRIKSSIEDSLELKYFESIIDFFVNQDELSTSEILFSNRSELLTHLGNHLKNSVADFDGSEEKIYLLSLFNSFKNLRSPFDASKVRFESFKSVAVLLTSGRDINRFYDNVVSVGVEEIKIALGIWGAVYGYATLPKTLTEEIFYESGKTNLLLKNLEQNMLFIANNDLNFPKVVQSVQEKQTNQKLTTTQQSKSEDLEKSKLLLIAKSLSADKGLNNEDIISPALHAFQEVYSVYSTGILNNSNEFLIKNIEESLKIKSKKYKALKKGGVIKKILGIMIHVLNLNANQV
jgi:hypothetical protein